MSNKISPELTPNVVVQNPSVRRVATVALGTLGLVLGTVLVVDASTPAFDLSPITIPVSAGYSYLAGIFGLAVTTPNIPRY